MIRTSLSDTRFALYFYPSTDISTCPKRVLPVQMMGELVFAWSYAKQSTEHDKVGSTKL